MPDPSKYTDSEKSKYMKDCMHQTMHVEKKDRDRSLAQCLNVWRQKHKKASEFLDISIELNKAIKEKEALDKYVKLHRRTFNDSERNEAEKESAQLIKTITDLNEKMTGIIDKIYPKKKSLASDIRETAIIAGLMDHAKEELDRAGLFDKDSDYEGMIGNCVMALMKVFCEQGHSGFSAPWVVDVFSNLTSWKTLTPISDDPSEWGEVEMDKDKKTWQNKRNPALFSNDEGKTFWDVDDKNKNIKNTTPHKNPS